MTKYKFYCNTCMAYVDELICPYCKGGVSMEKYKMISLDRYKELLRAEIELNLLDVAGVDNWEGYSYALYYNSGHLDELITKMEEEVDHDEG